VLDHAGNLSHFAAYPESFVPSELHSGDRNYQERKQTKTEPKEPILHNCKQCSGAFTGLRCKCGWELPIGTPTLKDDGTQLVKAENLSPAETRRKTLTKEQKQAVVLITAALRLSSTTTRKAGRTISILSASPALLMA
jgi:hypothetical protein